MRSCRRAASGGALVATRAASRSQSSSKRQRPLEQRVESLARRGANRRVGGVPFQVAVARWRLRPRGRAGRRAARRAPASSVRAARGRRCARRARRVPPRAWRVADRTRGSFETGEGSSSTAPASCSARKRAAASGTRPARSSAVARNPSTCGESSTSAVALVAEREQFGIAVRFGQRCGERLERSEIGVVVAQRFAPGGDGVVGPSLGGVQVAEASPVGGALGTVEKRLETFERGHEFFRASALLEERDQCLVRLPRSSTLGPALHHEQRGVRDRRWSRCAAAPRDRARRDGRGRSGPPRARRDGGSSCRRRSLRPRAADRCGRAPIADRSRARAGNAVPQRLRRPLSRSIAPSRHRSAARRADVVAASTGASASANSSSRPVRRSASLERAVAECPFGVGLECASVGLGGAPTGRPICCSWISPISSHSSARSAASVAGSAARRSSTATRSA